MWDHNYTLYIDKLESVQKFATKVILRDWNSCCNNRMKLLNLPLLSIRRKRQKLSLCYRTVSVRSIIPPSLFTPHSCPSLRHAHHMPLYYPRFRTTSYQSSFYVSVIPLGALYTGPLCLLLALVLYVSVIPLWNTLHRTIVSSPGSSSLC